MNMFQVFLAPAKAELLKAFDFLVVMFSVIIILIAGWLIAKVIRSAVIKALRAIRLDNFSDWIELDNLLEKGGIKYSLSELFGAICYWLTLLITFIVTLSTINLIPQSLVEKVVSYVPHVITALFILVLGKFAAVVVKNIVTTASVNAGISFSALLANLAEVIIVLFAVFIALEQLNIGIRITELTLGIILGSLGLGLALAFGLGCKDIAGKIAAEFIEKLKTKK